MPTGGSSNGIFGGGDGVANRRRRAGRRIRAVKYAIADRACRSERRREPDRLAIGALSNPRVLRTNDTIQPAAVKGLAIRTDPIRRSVAIDGYVAIASRTQAMLFQRRPMHRVSIAVPGNR